MLQQWCPIDVIKMRGRLECVREIEWNLGILDVVISTVKWPNKILFVHKDICNSCTIVDWFRFFPLDVGLLWLNHVSARVHLLFIIFVWFNFFSFISFCMLAVVLFYLLVLLLSCRFRTITTGTVCGEKREEDQPWA